MESGDLLTYPSRSHGLLSPQATLDISISRPNRDTGQHYVIFQLLRRDSVLLGRGQIMWLAAALIVYVTLPIGIDSRAIILLLMCTLKDMVNFMYT